MAQDYCSQFLIQICYLQTLKLIANFTISVHWGVSSFNETDSHSFPGKHYNIEERIYNGHQDSTALTRAAEKWQMNNFL